MKAPGPDSIQNWAWSLAWEIVSQHIMSLFKASIEHGFVPEQWKIIQKTMLVKAGKKGDTQPGALRPRALLSTLGKLFKKTLTQYMSQEAKIHGILHPGHYGVSPGRSSQDALIHLVLCITEHGRPGRFFCTIFADVKSGFPAVHHPKMLHTLGS